MEGFPREKILAVVVRLINNLYFRLGSEKSVVQYRALGITTLRNYHLHILSDGKLLLRFTGKQHVLQRRVLVDADLAALMNEYNQGITLTNFRRKAERAIRHSPPEYEIEELELMKLFELR